MDLISLCTNDSEPVTADSSAPSDHPRSNTSRTKRRCPYCTFTSFYAASLTVHLRRHTGERPYQCPYCPKGKTFRDRSNMNSHIRRFHKGGGTRRSKFLNGSKNIPSYSTRTDVKKDHTYGSSLDEVPIIKSVHSEQSDVTTISENPCENEKATEITTVPIMKPFIAEKVQSLSRPNRRKPSVVRRKHIPTALGLNDTSVFSMPTNRYFGIEFDNQSEDENLHAFHREATMLSEVFPQSPSKIEAMNLKDTPTTSAVVGGKREELISPPLEGYYCCKHCDIYFKNCILHTLHMGCHGFDDPFKCNTCGVKCKDSIEFHCHFARGNHDGVL